MNHTPLIKTLHKNMSTLIVVYFDQLLGATRTLKLVEMAICHLSLHELLSSRWVIVKYLVRVNLIAQACFQVAICLWKNKLKNYLLLSHLCVFLKVKLSWDWFLGFFQNSFWRSPQIGFGMTYVVASVTNKHLNFGEELWEKN